MHQVKKTGFRVLFKALSVIVLFFLVYKSSFEHKRTWGGRIDHRRIMQESQSASNYDETKSVGPQICADLVEHKGFPSHCDYLLAHPDCSSGGFFNYIKFFYCDCKNFTPVGYLVLVAWLAVLFYLLGNTASDYFCCSLEKLSDLLNMSPTVAGVTLLPLGNGAPDVFASIAAFAGSGSDDVGFNGVMGGAVFITCVVVGVVAFSIADNNIQIDRKCFIRDVSFFLVSVVCLGIILVVGKVNTWGAMGFVSIYVVYAVFVAMSEILRRKKGLSSSLRENNNSLTPLLPVGGGLVTPNDDSHLNPWMCSVSIYTDYVKVHAEDNAPTPLWGWTDEGDMNGDSLFTFSKLCSLFEIPLVVPRRLTIPIVEEDRWSKAYAVASAFLAPVLLAFLWNTSDNVGPWSSKIAYFIGLSIGSILGLLAFFYTSRDHPPRSCLLPWVCGGFFMSIIWFYVIADELVSLLVSFGIILGVNPSILALTVLAWGNSMNDLMSNTALAMNDRKGAQIAMSGCYAGPMFNTLVGLGVSLLIGTLSKGGSVPYYVVPRDGSLLITLGFLGASLVYALIVLPLSDMRPNKVLAVGLVTIYLMFLSVRVVTAMSSSGAPNGVGIKMPWA